ncbi:E3 SUMO-protein ligase ZBED1-like [Pimephales promelas]|uniref:E3 SUMO-protein ligase ZBED1-like n=1 Tax=Pimephales promelas TaxID=90988 RepID=UPI001955A8CD|nr:E3 SUMO-protein ligase ZBED1-like [Pimephales promelas]
MATGGAAVVTALVDKKGGKSHVWKHFGFAADDEGNIIDPQKPICKRCHRSFLSKAGNTSNLIKHLKDRHPDLMKEFKQMQGEEDHETPQQTLKQPTVTEAFQRQQKYDKNSPEARKLNRAVAEFICMDKVPIYTVQKCGFQQLLHHFNPKYQLPSRNFFMYTEIPRIYNDTRDLIMQHLGEKPFYSCTTDLWTSRTADTFMSVTLQYITKSWELQSWCLGCCGLNTDHTAESLKEAFEEKLEDWKLDIARMSGITTDNATNNKKAFEDYTWIPCFGHNLHLAVNKAIEINRVSAALSRLRKTISAFTRSPKLSRQLAKKQKDLSSPDHKLIHDEPTRWNSSYDMVERFLEQQQVVCAVLAEDRKKWYLMPKDSDITVLETVKAVLEPLSPFTDALSGEKHTTLSSVLPLLWKIFECLSHKQSDSALAQEMKEKIHEYLKHRYDDLQLQFLLNTATYLDPRFKNSFVSLKGDDVKQSLLDEVRKMGNAESASRVSGGESSQEVRPSKKSKNDLKHLLSSIQGEKKEKGEPTCSSQANLSASDELNGEFLVYSQMPEISAEDDPLSWWKTNMAMAKQSNSEAIVDSNSVKSSAKAGEYFGGL